MLLMDLLTSSLAFDFLLHTQATACSFGWRLVAGADCSEIKVLLAGG
jgi:hypothetical protein